VNASPEFRALPSWDWGRDDARSRFFDQAAEHTSLVAVDCDGLTFLVSTSDRGLGRRFFEARARNDSVFLARAVEHLGHAGRRSRSRRVLVDVGASLGTVCVTALLRHGFRRALALEPGPENFRLLRANLTINGVDDRVDAHPVAAWNGSAEAVTLYRRRAGRYGLRGSAARWGSIEVPAATVDDLLARSGLEPRDVGLLWVDVDGNEEDVLRGASALLEARVPLVVEVTRKRTLPLRLLAGRYERFVDLRATTSVVPITGLERIAAAMVDRVDRRESTDVLLLP
jgi:FkbM family methyltransferase